MTVALEQKIQKFRHRTVHRHRDGRTGHLACRTTTGNYRNRNRALRRHCRGLRVDLTRRYKCQGCPCASHLHASLRKVRRQRILHQIGRVDGPTCASGSEAISENGKETSRGQPLRGRNAQRRSRNAHDGRTPGCRQYRHGRTAAGTIESRRHSDGNARRESRAGSDRKTATCLPRLERIDRRNGEHRVTRLEGDWKSTHQGGTAEGEVHRCRRPGDQARRGDRHRSHNGKCVRRAYGYLPCLGIGQELSRVAPNERRGILHRCHKAMSSDGQFACVQNQIGSGG